LTTSNIAKRARPKEASICITHDLCTFELDNPFDLAQVWRSHESKIKINNLGSKHQQEVWYNELKEISIYRGPDKTKLE
jgi:hypothetical protein